MLCSTLTIQIALAPDELTRSTTASLETQTDPFSMTTREHARGIAENATWQARNILDSLKEKANNLSKAAADTAKRASESAKEARSRVVSSMNDVSKRLNETISEHKGRINKFVSSLTSDDFASITPSNNPNEHQISPKRLKRFVSWLNEILEPVRSHFAREHAKDSALNILTSNRNMPRSQEAQTMLENSFKKLQTKQKESVLNFWANERSKDLARTIKIITNDPTRSQDRKHADIQTAITQVNAEAANLAIELSKALKPNEVMVPGHNSKTGDMVFDVVDMSHINPTKPISTDISTSEHDNKSQYSLLHRRGVTNIAPELFTDIAAEWFARKVNFNGGDTVQDQLEATFTNPAWNKFDTKLRDDILDILLKKSIARAQNATNPNSTARKNVEDGYENFSDRTIWDDQSSPQNNANQEVHDAKHATSRQAELKARQEDRSPGKTVSAEEARAARIEASKINSKEKADARIANTKTLVSNGKKERPKERLLKKQADKVVATQKETTTNSGVNGNDILANFNDHQAPKGALDQLKDAAMLLN